MDSTSSPLVTFVIPTTGRRDSLFAALRSLQAQTDPRWQAVVVADGGSAFDALSWDDDDGELQQMLENGVSFMHGAESRSAGLTRNQGIDLAVNLGSPWIAFLDDDDTLDPNYVDALSAHDAWGIHDLVVFRADWPDGTVLPDPDEPRLEWGRVGISFAVRSTFLRQGHRFIRENLFKPGLGGNEDITLLRELLEVGARHTISPFVLYHVRPHETAP